MEVSVLQWLSDDPALGRILRGKKDVYEQIWCKATGLKRDDNSRDNGKSTFLPVVYGLGPKGLAKRLEKREDLAAWIINSYYKTFPKAFQWLRQQTLDEEGYAADYFGRKRWFDEENIYKSRNFLVQAPANIICLKKLITLRESIKDFAKLAFHLHDGYCILVKNTDWKKAYLKATESLETEDKLFPNLRLTTSCEAGVTLKSLKPISRR
jgi:DNA polymerase I-like protein with 3'-5' exonuclease and polymerase domains